jgi:hypothetical protein
MSRTTYEALFTGLQLPVRPAKAATSASIELLEEPVAELGATPFFGGYAEDFLADMGLDQVAEAPAPARAKQA